MKWGLLLIGLVCVGAVFGSFTVQTVSQNNVTELLFDRANSTINGTVFFGSDSYRDHTPTTEDLRFTVCWDNLTPGMFFDLEYFTESRNITGSLLLFRPQITSTFIQNGTVCSNVNPFMVSTRTLYPGFFEPVLYYEAINTTPNATNPSFIAQHRFSPFEIPFNGSFEIGINVRYPPKQYLIRVTDIYDNNNLPITRSASQIFKSIVDVNGTIINEAQLSPLQPIVFNGSFRGGERIYVNGIKSLEILVYEPCQGNIINESGYYVLNRSEFNANGTCIEIENTRNVVFNFVGELISGDNLSNGSRAPGTCPITVRNSQEITIQQLSVNEFYYGICIENSTVDVIGGGNSFNTVGALITKGSNVSLNELIFLNDETEIVVNESSYLRVRDVAFVGPKAPFTNLFAEFFDTTINQLRIDPPELPDIENITDIGQWVEIKGIPGVSWAQINFSYTIPVPNNASVDNVSIFRYDTELIPVFNNATNTTEMVWSNATWIELFTLVAPQTQMIIGPRLENFSLIVPLAYPLQTEAVPEPEPTPTPRPQPDPGSGPPTPGPGGGGGGGGIVPVTEAEQETPINPEAILLELELPELVRIEQGELFGVSFNLTNLGNVSASNILISAQVPDQWETGEFSWNVLAPGEVITDVFPIGPHDRAIPTYYQIPVRVYVGGGEFLVLSEILEVLVLPQGDLRRIRILDYPPVITMSENSFQRVQFSIENTGQWPLSGVQIRFEENTPCLKEVTGSNSIGLGETALWTYTFYSGELGTCSFNILFYDEEDRLVGFAPMTFNIVTPQTLERALKLLLLVLLSVWTALTAIVLMRKRRDGR